MKINSKKIFWVTGILILIVLMLFSSNLVPQDISGDNGGSGSDTTYSCIDSDEGLSYYMVGHATDQDGLKYYDKCEDNLLTEYYCSNNKVTTREFACPLEYSCEQTRSGGYCQPLPTWNDGDVVGSNGGIGSSLAPTNSFDIDLSNDFIPGGTCGLKAQINAGWTYGNQNCQGIQGQEGVVWELWDSDSLEWSRVDSSPSSLGAETDCVLDYDGTPFTFKINKLTNLYPECEIDYNWDVTILACGC